MKRVLFLCSGNYYRSRFAEIVFNWQAEMHQSGWRADSRGLAVDSRNPGPISAHTLRILADRGILPVCDNRFPIDATVTDFATANHVVAVKECEHRRMIDARFPDWSDRVEYWHIDDLDCATPDVAIPQLESQVIELLNRLQCDSAPFELQS